MNNSNKNIPSPSLLPHMIEDKEVPALIRNAENAQISIERREKPASDRAEKNKQSKFIVGAAIGATAVVALVARHHEINKIQDPITNGPNTPEHIDTPYVNVGADKNGFTHFVPNKG